MIRHLQRIAAVSLLLTAAEALGADDDVAPSRIAMTSFVGKDLWHAADSMRILRASEPFIGLHADIDMYGGFADADGDGRDDLLVMAEHERTCDEDSCDVFVFALVVENRKVDTPCDWQFVDKQRRPIRWTNGDRFTIVNDRAVPLELMSEDMGCTLNRKAWPDYFHFVFDKDPAFMQE